MAHSKMRCDIQRTHHHEEQEPVTDHANNNTSPQFTHSSSLRSHIQTARIAYFPFGKRPFFSSSWICRLALLGLEL